MSKAHETALLEIGTEELPSRFFYEGIEQLKALAEKKLTASRLTFGGINVYGTPRRMALEVRELVSRQPDIEKEVRGPAQASAYDKEGKPTPALSGFLKSQNVSLDSVAIKEFSGKPYVVVKVEEKGKPTSELLARLLPEMIRELTFPKSMKWNGDFAFGRPIRWLLALFGDTVVPFELAGLKSDRFTFGHRFLSTGEISIGNPSEYQEKLKKAFVIADHPTRQKLIREEARSLAGEQRASIYPVSASFEEEVTMLVEYPTPFVGKFEERFLALPKDVLVTVMEHHQRYFPLVKSDGKLLNAFVAVRNGDTEGLDEVRFGNEQVIRARFKDAEYFFQTDRKTKLRDRLSTLEKLVFQKNLGTIRQKVERIKILSQEIATACNLKVSAQELTEVAELCKCDLATQMVFEFPELQGVMGKEYAKLENYSESTCQAILDHYLPRFQGDTLPQTDVGTVFALADRIDMLVGCFGLGLKPTGSSDPLGLRRAATTLLQILLEKNLEFNLEKLFALGFTQYQNQELLKGSEVSKTILELSQFLAERSETLWKAAGIRYDFIRVFQNLALQKPASVFKRAQFLDSFRSKNKEAFIAFVTAWIRVFNILKSKEAANLAKEFTLSQKLDLAKLKDPEERTLAECYEKFQSQVGEALSKNQFEAAWKILSEFESPINAFFDKVLVMAPEPDLRKARIHLLWNLQHLMLDDFGDLTQIVLD